MNVRPDVRFTIEDAQARFDDLLDMVEKGKNVGIMDKGKLRGILAPVTSGVQALRTDSGFEAGK